MAPERPSAAELFNTALEAFTRGELDEAVAALRTGFFENLYMAPAILGEEPRAHDIWHGGPEASPEAAMEYVTRYGQLWRETDDSLVLVEDVWTDPIVRRELKSYVNLSKAILQAPAEALRSEYLREREWFIDPRRVRGTQSEILARLERKSFSRPLERPRFDSLHLACRDPASTVEFYRDLLEIEPVRSSRRAGGYAEFELPGLRLVIHGHDRLAPGDPYSLGPPPRSLGWGAIFLLRVREIDRYLENAGRKGIVVLDSDMEARGQRFFLVKDPSGYLVEISE